MQNINTSIDSIVKNLGGRKTKDGWQCHCPSHDDKNPSLSISLGANGKLLVKCFAGCDQNSVINSLRELQLWPTKSSESVSKETIEIYQDYEGKDSLKVVRKDFNGAKKFTQWRYEDNKWIPKAPVSAVAPLFYIEWKSQDSIILVEGEKCARALVEVGLHATATPGGSGAWRSHYTKAFENKIVTIVPDKDEPGHKYANNAFRDIAKVAKSVRILNLESLNPGEDVFDWLKKGGTKEDLSLLVTNVHKTEEPPHKELEKLVCLNNIETTSVEFLIEPYFPLGKVSLISGDPGVGKSTFASLIASIVSSGESPSQHFLSKNQTGNVVFFSSEEDPSDTLRPKCERHKADLSKIYVYPDPFELNKEGLEIVEAVLSKVAPISLVIFDTLQNYFGSKDMNKVNEAAEVMTAIQSFAKKYGCSILCVRHLKKGSDKANYRGMGSIGITGAARSELLLGANQSNKSELALIHIKSNCAAYGPSLGLKIEDGAMKVTGFTQLTEEDLLRNQINDPDQASERDEAGSFLLESLNTGPALAKNLQREADSLGISQRTLNRAKKDLKIESIKVGGNWFWQFPIETDQDCQVS